MLATLVAAIVGPYLAFVKLRAENKAVMEMLITRVERNLGASVKLLEVRNYYAEMTGQFKKMLDEALKEGNRFQQDQVRKLQERLEQLKARTLDNTVRMLEPGQNRPPHKRRRRGGRSHRPHTNQNRPQQERRGPENTNSAPKPE